MTTQKAREPPTNEKSLGGAAGLLHFKRIILDHPFLGIL